MTSCSTSPSAMGRSIPRRGTRTRYPSGIGPIVESGVGETDGAVVETLDVLAVGDAGADALGRASGATDPARGMPPPATRARPTARSSAAGGRGDEPGPA